MGSAAEAVGVTGDAATGGAGVTDRVDPGDETRAVASAAAPGTARIWPVAPPRDSEPESSVPSPANASASSTTCSVSGLGMSTRGSTWKGRP